MGKYYNPPEEIEKVGRKLGKGPEGCYGLVQQLQEDEVIFSLVDCYRSKPPHKAAMLIESMEDYVETNRGHIQLVWELLGFYALTINQVATNPGLVPGDPRKCKLAPNLRQEVEDKHREEERRYAEEKRIGTLIFDWERYKKENGLE